MSILLCAQSKLNLRIYVFLKSWKCSTFLSQILLLCCLPCLLVDFSNNFSNNYLLWLSYSSLPLSPFLHCVQFLVHFAYWIYFNDYIFNFWEFFVVLTSAWFCLILSVPLLVIVLLTEDLRYIYLKSFLDYNFTFVWSEFMELFISLFCFRSFIKFDFLMCIGIFVCRLILRGMSLSTSLPTHTYTISVRMHLTSCKRKSNSPS